ncbi:MAG: bifunctional folylpolyglutamate synthase/dihydrofolate synthase, partial [Myxococcota bacterium]
AALAARIAETAPGSKAHILFAVLAEKPAEALLELLRPVAASLTLTSAGGDRAVPPLRLEPLVESWEVPVHIEPDPLEALEAARRRAQGGLIVACGSLYLVGALRAGLGTAPDPGDPSTVTGLVRA